MDIKMEMQKVKTEFEALNARKAELNDQYNAIEDRQKNLIGRWDLLRELGAESGIDLSEFVGTPEGKNPAAEAPVEEPKAEEPEVEVVEEKKE